MKKPWRAPGLNPGVGWAIRYYIASVLIRWSISLVMDYATPEQGNAFNLLADSFLNDERYKALP
jgi:hypothetical protein